jgi:hypothetical protein
MSGIRMGHSDPAGMPASGSVGRTSPVDDLQSIVPMILDVTRRDSVLARYDGPRRLVAEDALQFAAQLTSLTEWDEGRLLRNLGCQLKTVGDLDAVSLERLQRCQKFLRLVARLTGLVDTVPDRRAVVMECVALLTSTSLSADDLEELVNTGAGFTPIDYIRLGEISAAGELARAQVSDREGHGSSVLPPGPFDGLPIVHLSAARIDMYLLDMSEALGDEVSQHISAHLENCEACSQAVAYRRQRVTA